MKRLLAAFLIVFFLAFAPPARAFLVEEEIIYPQSLPICNEFDVQYHQESEVTGPMGIPVQGVTTEKGLKEISGRLEVKGTDFPDFAAMENNFVQALTKILPQELKQQVSLDETTLKTKFTHYPQARDEADNIVAADKNPEATFDQPGWFTKMLGETKIFCGLMGSCPAPKSFNIKIAEPSLASLSFPQAFCQYQQNILGDAVDNLQNPQPEFVAKTIWEKVIDYLEDLVNSIFHQKTTEDATLTVLGSGPMVGAQTMSSQVTFADAFLPSELGLQGNQRQSSNTDIQLSENFNIVGDEKFKTPSGKIQKSLCLMQAGLYPSGIDAFASHAVCNSRNADDYPLDPNFGSGVDDVPLDMSLCQWDPDNQGCHYYDPGGTQGCGPNQDAFCESGRCNPFEYGQAEDFLSNGCSLPYGDRGTNCNVASICQWAHFQKNPAGGFGACQYRNPDVCVRTDRIATGSCAAVCNNACCAWQ